MTFDEYWDRLCSKNTNLSKSIVFRMNTTEFKRIVRYTWDAAQQIDEKPQQPPSCDVVDFLKNIIGGGAK
jgi:hypothetical protein